jgi:hypothetical protein
MADIHKTYRLANHTVSTLEMKSIQTLLREIGLAPDGALQAFHTNNVLRRILKYWAARSGMTLKVIIAQTDINTPEIVADVPYAAMLFTGKTHRGTAIRYTKTKNKLAGPRPDKALEAAEGPAMAADLMREIRRRGIS